MKLKQLPTDFKVEEISEVKALDSGKYSLFVLEKAGLESFYVFNYLSRKLSIAISDFGYAGLKDTHALTRQFVTIPSKFSIGQLTEKNFSLTPLGFVDEPITLGNLKGNHFEITARCLLKGDLPGVYEKAKTIGKIGVPNYFDSQRFGSVANNNFVVRLLMLHRYEEAVRLFLAPTRFDSSDERLERSLLADNWNNLSKVKIQNPIILAVLQEYLKTDNWLLAYKKVPSNLREMHVSSYQSYLWNECVRILLRDLVDKKYLYTIDYDLGTLLFYKRLTDSERASLQGNFRTISEDTEFGQIDKRIVALVLKKEQLTLQDFDIKHETGSFFKSHERTLTVRPDHFVISEPELDDLNGRNNRFKVRLVFDLPKGSYATIVTKRLFNH